MSFSWKRIRFVVHGWRCYSTSRRRMERSREPAESPARSNTRRRGRRSLHESPESERLRRRPEAERGGFGFPVTIEKLLHVHADQDGQRGHEEAFQWLLENQIRPDLAGKKQ